MDRKPGLMERLNACDIIGKCQPHVNNNEFSYDLQPDAINFRTQLFTTDNWLHTKYDLEKSCHVWFTKYFGIFRCVPRKCLNHCYKLCATDRGFDDDRKQVRQLSLSEVMDINEFQERLGLNSKVGMDDRDYTPSLWGAYWYTDSLKAAYELYPAVRAGLDDINPDIVLNVKRACTEFELYLGPSNEWDGKDFPWEETEKVLEKWVEHVPNHMTTSQHELIQQTIKLRFLHWAHMHGDMTYREFIDGDNLEHGFKEIKKVPIVPSVTYNP